MLCNILHGAGWLDRLYLQDPDLVVFGKDWIAPALGKLLGPWFTMDARARVAKAVVAGGLLLNGDDLSNATSAAAARRWLGAPLVNAALRAARGRAFRPLHARAWVLAAHVFELDLTVEREEERRSAQSRHAGGGERASAAEAGGGALDGAYAVLAAFNYGPLRRTFAVDVARSAVGKRRATRCVDLWTGAARAVAPGATTLALEVAPRSSVLLAYFDDAG